MTTNELLEAIYSDLQVLKKNAESTNERLMHLEEHNIDFSNDLQSLKADVAQIPDMRRDINLILEGQQGINEKFQKLDKVAEDVEEIKEKVTALEEVTRSNTSQIKKLRIAK